MADTGAPLNLTLMEVGQFAKEAVFNDAIQAINAGIGGGGSGSFTTLASSQTFTLSGDISPAQITSNQDNYAPTGIATASILRLNTDASRNLTGITTGADGRLLLVLNIGSFPLVLVDDATSTAANRFQLNGDVTLAADEGVVLWYDSTSSRWRLVADYRVTTFTAASESASGVAELATQGEADTGTDDARIVTPLKLATATSVIHPARSISTTAPLTGGGDLSANRTFAVSAATTSASGVSELATNTETSTGTDTGRTISPDALAHSNYGITVVSIQVTDPNGAALTTGDGKAFFRVPSTLNGFDVIAVAAHVTTVSSSGAPSIQIHNVTDAVDILSTNITIDQSEKDSATAATPAVINASNDSLATADELRIDIDGAGTGAKGLIVEIQARLP